MASRRSVFYCSDCGHEEPRWLGRCPGCEAWNTFKEKTLSEKSKDRPPRGGLVVQDAHPRPFHEIELKEGTRHPTGLSELDRVLGGGMVPGSAVLVGGEPGIGKSTLMMQLCETSLHQNPILYVSGEESPEQIKMRGDRLGVKKEQLLLFSTTGLEEILASAEACQPSILIIDSIQTVYSPFAGDIPGTVNQLKYCTFELIRFCKSCQTTLFLLAHVTKEGNIAGPKAIEHMVDTVLLFEPLEGDFRSIRPVKNRFGPTDEIGLLSMDSQGLRQITNPAGIFMDTGRKEMPPGVSIGAVYEGSRILMVEIQALTVPCKGGGARNYSDRIDPIRISRIAAILEKYTGISFSDHDLYINVAGGFRIIDIGCDLAVALALFSARSGLSLKKGLLGLGELSLSGEIRPVNQLSRRVKTAEELGLSEVICHVSDRERTAIKGGTEKIRLISSVHIKDAIKAAFQPDARDPSNKSN
jgi:DNA repair protein RadA/Sms